MNEKDCGQWYVMTMFEKKREESLQIQREITKLRERLGYTKEMEEHYLSLLKEMTEDSGK